MSELNLEQCNLFNPGLIHAFEPECRVGDDNGSYSYLKDCILQKIDMFDALVYAQSTIIPEICTGWGNITPQQVTEWISKIHALISKTLLSNTPEHIGKYPAMSIVVLRFHHGARLKEYLLTLLTTDKMSTEYARLFNETCTEFKITTPELFQSFLDLCLKIANDASIDINPEYTRNLPGRVMQRLRTAWYSEGLLTPGERNIISTFLMVCLPADELPAAMDEFSRNVIDVMLNLADSDEIARSHKLAEIFYQLVSIHPFVNANGRTATVFLNTLLVSLGLPSILLRYPGDREDETSLYCQAMKEIDDSREKLAALIAHRLSSPPYNSELSENIMLIQYELYALLKSIHDTFGFVCVTKFFDKIIDDVGNVIDMQRLEEEDGELKVRLDANKLMLTERNNFFTKSSEFATPKSISVFIIAKLKQLTGEDWKISQKTGNQIAWTIFKSTEHQQTCLASLRNCFVGTETTIKDGKPKGKSDSWMIQIENINLDALSKVLTAQNTLVLV